MGIISEIKQARRQGDVLIITTENYKIPEDVKLEPIKVLFKGKNHDHYFTSGKALFSQVENKRYLRVLEDADLSHGRGDSTEHHTKTVPKGDYWVEIQTETDHVKNIKREVID